MSEVDSSVDEQRDVDNDDDKEEADKGEVVLNVSPAHEGWDLLTKFVFQRFLGSWFWRNKPLANGQGQVFKKALVFSELVTQIIHTDSIFARFDSIIIKSHGKVINLFFIKLHSILSNTGLDDLPEL